MSNLNIFHTFRTSCILLREIYRCSKKPWHWTGRIVLSENDSRDPLLQDRLLRPWNRGVRWRDRKSWAHTFGPSRAQKNETRHMYCQSFLLLAFVTISRKDQRRRRASNPFTLLFPFPNIPFTNRFRKFSTAICRKGVSLPRICNSSG